MLCQVQPKYYRKPVVLTHFLFAQLFKCTLNIQIALHILPFFFPFPKPALGGLPRHSNLKTIMSSVHIPSQTHTHTRSYFTPYYFANLLFLEDLNIGPDTTRLHRFGFNL